MDGRWFRPPLCKYRGEPPKDGEMNEMTLPSRHRIRALAVQGRARYHLVTEAPINIESSRVSGEEIFCFFET